MTRCYRENRRWRRDLTISQTDLTVDELVSAGEAAQGASRWELLRHAHRVIGLFVILALIPMQAVCDDDVKQDRRSDWSRIETIPAGHRIKVRFVENESSKPVSAKGRFSSYSESAIVLALKSGVSQSIPKEFVREVRARQPFFKRKAGWIAGIGVAAVACALWTCDEDITFLFVPILTAGYAAPAGFVGSLVTPTKLIYRSSMSDD